MESEEHSSSPEVKKWTKLKTRKLMKTGVVILAVLLFLAIFTNKLDFLKPTGWTTGDYGTADVEFYVMSQCPYGTQVENAIKPVLDELGDNINFKLNFIANDNGDGTFASLHGQPEVDEDLKQVCAMKLSPESYMDYIVCQNKDIKNAASNWESCAEEANINVEALRTCSEGNEGKQLLSESITKSNAAQAMGSPTIFIGNQAYVGGRDPTSFTMAICSLLDNHPACSDMPECASNADCTAEPKKIGQCVENECKYVEDAPFEVIVINDKNCGAECDTSQILATTKQLFLGVTFKDLDVSDAEAQELIDKLGLKFVPAYLFGADVTKTFMWQAQPKLATSFEKKGEYLKLLDQATGATHWIDEEAKAAYEAEQAKKFDKFGIKLDDGKPTVNLMIMSQCPYGVSAFDAMKPVVDLFGDKIDFQVDFIGQDNGDGTFSSLHGSAEVDEDLRQVCAAKIAPKKYLEYVSCQNKDIKNAGSNWEKCAVDSGIDKVALQSCSEGEQGKTLLSDSIEISNLFGASGSPTLMLEGQLYQGKRTPSAYQSAICSLFKDKPEECANALNDEGVQEAPAGGCGA